MRELRPCIFVSYGKRHKGLFHCWAVSERDERYIKKGETVALIESEKGTVVKIHSNRVYFLDTDKQMEKFELLKGGAE